MHPTRKLLAVTMTIVAFFMAAQVNAGDLSNLTGTWTGTWNSEISGHEGPLKAKFTICLLYTSPSPRDATLSRMPSSA